MKIPLTTESTEITERISRKFALDVHSDPEAFDPLGQLPDVEMDQETSRAAGELELQKNLGFMDRDQFQHSLFEPLLPRLGGRGKRDRLIRAAPVESPDEPRCDLCSTNLQNLRALRGFSKA